VKMLRHNHSSRTLSPAPAPSSATRRRAAPLPGRPFDSSVSSSLTLFGQLGEPRALATVRELVVYPAVFAATVDQMALTRTEETADPYAVLFGLVEVVEGSFVRMAVRPSAYWPSHTKLCYLVQPCVQFGVPTPLETLGDTVVSGAGLVLGVPARKLRGDHVGRPSPSLAVLSRRGSFHHLVPPARPVVCPARRRQ